MANIQSFISIDRNGIPSSSLQVCNVRDAVFCDMKQFKGNALQGKKIFFFKLLLYYHAKWAKMHLLCSMYLQQFGYQTMAFLSKFRFFKMDLLYQFSMGLKGQFTLWNPVLPSFFNKRTRRICVKKVSCWKEMLSQFRKF